MVPSFSFWFGVGSGGQSGQRCPQGTLPQPSPHGSCFPRAGVLRIAPPAKGQTTAGRGRGIRVRLRRLRKARLGRRITVCQLDRAVAPGLEPTTTSPRSEEERSRQEKCGGGRNETARLRDIAVDRKLQLWGGERGRTVVEMWQNSKRSIRGGQISSRKKRSWQIAS